MKEEIDEKAYFGIFYENVDDKTFIKANKSGVEVFINELKNKLNDFDFHLEKNDHFATINFIKGDWFDKNSNIRLDWIEPTDKSRNDFINLTEEISKSKWYDGIVSFFGKVLFFFILASFFIGIFTSLKWIFQLIFL